MSKPVGESVAKRVKELWTDWESEVSLSRWRCGCVVLRRIDGAENPCQLGRKGCRARARTGAAITVGLVAPSVDGFTRALTTVRPGIEV